MQNFSLRPRDYALSPQDLKYSATSVTQVTISHREVKGGVEALPLWALS